MNSFAKSATALCALALAANGCAASLERAPKSAGSESPAQAPLPPETPSVPPQPPSPTAPPAASAERAETEAGRACGELACRAFASPRAAFEFALRGAPRVIAIGESHAQKDAPKVPSATERFRTELLPLLAARAKAIVIELLLPDKRCQKSEVKEVAKRQEAVTRPQAETNQNEFVTLGRTARELGMVPQPLVPSCEELRVVLGAGSADIDAFLKLIANITLRETLALLDAGAPDKAVVTYGGLVHNDRAPRAGREAWSFGPRLLERTGERYVEIDLVVPEFVRPEPPWTNLPWYSAFDADKTSTETRLFESTPGSFVLVFPRGSNEKALP